jgi:hypothetical protein
MEKRLVDWDTKVFKKNVFEIQNTDFFDRNRIKEIDESCNSNEAFMSFIKVKNHEFDKIHYLEEIGFNYMESQYEIVKILTVPYKVSTYSKYCSLRLLDHSDGKTVDKLTNIITTIFDTDRYYLDPQLDKKYSGMRYKNWFLNSLSDEKFLTYYYLSKKDNNIIGFLMVKMESNEIYLALGGISNNFKGFGFYTSLLTDYLNQVYLNGVKKIFTTISCHNLEILNIYINLGFSVVDEKIVMRKIYH